MSGETVAYCLAFVLTSSLMSSIRRSNASAMYRISRSPSVSPSLAKCRPLSLLRASLSVVPVHGRRSASLVAKVESAGAGLAGAVAQQPSQPCVAYVDSSLPNAITL